MIMEYLFNVLSKRYSSISLTICFILSTLFLVSCLDSAEKGTTGYLPFKSSSDGRWGLMGTDGVVLFEDEFKDIPTSAVNDRFLVKTGNNTWEIYTAEPKPQRIGEEYIQIADFTCAVTPAVKKNERINLINVDGEVVATLDKVGSKSIIRCSGFKFGYAGIVTDDEKCGIIDTKGKVIIEPKYDLTWTLSGNSFLTLTKKDNKENSDNAFTLSVLDSSSKQLFSIQLGDGQKYIDINLLASTPKYLAVCITVDGERQWGYIDYSNNVIVKPSNKIKEVISVRGDKFIYRSSDGYGVMNFDGEVVVRGKYDQLNWATDEILIAYSSDTNYYLINLEGEKLTKDSYLDILPFFDGSHAAAKVSDNSWCFIDKKGEEVKIKNAPDIYYITDNSADLVVESDYLDIDAIISKIQLIKNGIMGYNLTMTPLQIARAYNEIAPEDEKRGLTPDDNRGCDRLRTNNYSRGVELSSELYYNKYMTDYSDNNKLIWSDEKPAYIEVNISGSKVSGKTDLIYSKVAPTIKSYGKVVKENSNAAVVKISDDQGWVVINTGSKVMLRIINGRSFYDYYIDEYAKEGESTKVIEKSPVEEIQEFDVLSDSIR